ncbi:hypothetical protein ACIO8G_38035 [Streptomyces sp. NPDC087219]|uniref:hypothetical protein n=1 Tax=unclassified Streptomyces TaxID=2593676 RepID=UPI00381CDBAD
MPENTVTAPLAPMEPEDVADAFAHIRALQAGDVDTACAVIEDTGGTEMRRLLLDVAARIGIPPISPPALSVTSVAELASLLT